MKKQLITTSIITSLLVTTNFFYSCAEYVSEELPTNSSQKGSIQIKILSGVDAGKTITNSGPGTLVGTKRFIENKFVGYQIVGTYANLQFTGGVFNEDGTGDFEDSQIAIGNMIDGYIYNSLEDDSKGSIKLTDIKLLDSYDAVGAQFINGKLTFKGKFEKVNTKLETVEEGIDIEGTVTF